MRQFVFTTALIGLATSSLLASGNGSIRGTYVEARTAEVFVGACVMNSEAGTGGRQAVLAWKIDQGSLNGVALDGLSVVAAVVADRNLGIQELGGERAHTKAAVFVDQRATAPQRTMLIAMANQLSKGIVDTVVDVTPTLIKFSDDDRAVHLAAGPVAVDVNKHGEHGPDCGAMQWFQPLSSTNEATMGLTERHTYTGSSLGSRWSDPNRWSAFFGTFTF